MGGGCRWRGPQRQGGADGWIAGWDVAVVVVAVVADVVGASVARRLVEQRRVAAVVADDAVGPPFGGRGFDILGCYAAGAPVAERVAGG